MKFVTEKKRSHLCGEITEKNVGEKVTVMGWVNNRRDHGGLVFVDLRDRQGLLQVVLDPAMAGTQGAKDLRNEFVIGVYGEVRARPAGMVNEKMASGAVELVAESCEILSAAETPPFVIDDPKVTENVRLKYRYLDLRSQKLQRTLKVRHEISQKVREFLSERGFLEIETPILYKSTPEGARDYLVPSRVNPGQFFALPQSPQTLKQLLMVGGMERYFQIARCFRDEDLRADRQPEFSQIDLEMSFVDEDDVRAVNEDMARSLWRDVKGVELEDFPVIPYSEAMEKWGSDKPDLRNPLVIQDCSSMVQGTGFKVFDNTLESGGRVRGIGLPVSETVSRSQIDRWMKAARSDGAAGLIWIKKEKGEYLSPVNKFLSQELLEKLYNFFLPKGEGTVLMVSDTEAVTSRALGNLRNAMGAMYDLIDKSKDRFCWVVDFPLLEYDNEGKRWVACHHPFTQPKDDHISLLASGEPESMGKVQAKAYDLVCNGHEVAGGSIRIHSSQIQETIFKALGLSPEEAQEKFGFFIEALKYGTPPHGGIAWGLDRLVMILCGTDAIRDVIAFPKTAKAQCLMSSTPSSVDLHQLIDLGIQKRSSLGHKVESGS